MTRVWEVPVHDSTRVRDVRVAAEEAADQAALGRRRGASAALVATELATNMLKYGGGGRIVIETVDRAAGGTAPVAGVQIVAVDHGPGIGDVTAATRDGYSTSASSLGAGLGTCRRVSDSFDLHSRPNAGTVVLARLSAGQDLAQRDWAGGVHLPLSGMPESGDAWVHRTGACRRTVMLVDGIGHGAAAAQASTAAVRFLEGHPDLSVSLLLRGLHSELRGTRGAAVAIAQIDDSTRRLAFGGVGNVGARLHTGGGWEHLLSRPGIVGAYAPASVNVAQRAWTPGSMLVLHSDGLPSRWRHEGTERLAGHDPALIAGVVFRDAGSLARTLRDDTTVAVVTDPAGEEK